MKYIIISSVFVIIFAFLHIYIYSYFDEITEPLKKDVGEEIFSEERSFENAYKLSTFNEEVKDNTLEENDNVDLEYLYKEVGHYANEVMAVELLKKELFENILKEKSDYINLGFVEYGIYIPDDVVNNYKKKAGFNEILAPFIKENSCLCFGDSKMDMSKLRDLHVSEVNMINLVKLHVIETEGLNICERNVSCTDAKLNGLYYFDVKRNVYYNEHLLESILNNVKNIKENDLKDHITNKLLYIDSQHYKNYASSYKISEFYTIIYKGVSTYLIRAISGYTINKNFEKNFELYERENYFTNLNKEKMKEIFSSSWRLNYFMISSHYDSSIQSPAVSDAGAYVAVMIELFRNLISRKIVVTPFILNFNGAEEPLLLSAHGFSNFHIWSLDVKYFINLDAIGHGGQFIIYRTSDENREILKFYKKYSINHAFSSLSQDVECFNNNVTDFNIYNSYMKSAQGLDIVTVLKGYFYHTSRDTVINLKKGTMQLLGNNLLEIISNTLRDMHDDSMEKKKEIVKNSSKDDFYKTDNFSFKKYFFNFMNTKIDNFINIFGGEHYFFYDFIPNHVLVISRASILLYFFILAFLKFFLSLIEKKLYNKDISIYSTLLILLTSYIFPLFLTLGLLYVFDWLMNFINLKIFYFTNIFLAYLIYGSLSYVLFYYIHYKVTIFFVSILKDKEISNINKMEQSKTIILDESERFYESRTSESLSIEQDVCLTVTEYNDIRDDGNKEDNKLVKNNKFDNTETYGGGEIQNKDTNIDSEKNVPNKKESIKTYALKEEFYYNELSLYMEMYGYNSSFYFYMFFFLLTFFLKLGTSFILLFFASGLFLVRVLTTILNLLFQESRNKKNKDSFNFNCCRNKLFVSYIPMIYVYVYIIKLSYWYIISSVPRSGFYDILGPITHDFIISVVVFLGIFALITLCTPLLIINKREFKYINFFFKLVFLLSFLYILLFLKSPFSEKTVKRVNIANVSIKVRDQMGNITNEYNGLSFGLWDSLKLEKYGFRFLNNREDLKEIYINEIKQFADKENFSYNYKIEFLDMRDLDKYYGYYFSIPHFCKYFSFVPYKSPIEYDINFSEQNEKDFYELDETYDDIQDELFENNSLSKGGINESDITINFTENKDLLNKNVTEENLKYELLYNGSIKTTLGYKKVYKDNITRIYIQLKASYITFMNILRGDIINWSFNKEFTDNSISHSIRHINIKLIYGNKNRITRFWLDIKDYKSPLTIVTKSCSFINLPPIVQKLIQRKNIFYINKVNQNSVNISLKKSEDTKIPSYVTSLGGKCEINIWNI